MPEGLPEGLVKNREGVTAVGGEVDRVEADQIALCWRVYYSKKAVFAENIGRRLENFFWRIWSSERLRQQLTGTQVNIQFDIINEGGFIRTTPTASPQSSKSLSVYYREARQRTPPTTPPSAEASTTATAFSKVVPSSADHDTEISPITLASTKTSVASETLSKDSPPRARRSSEDALAHPKVSEFGTGKAKKLDNFSNSGGIEDSSVTPTPISPIAALEQSSEDSKENRRAPENASRRPPILKKGSSGSSRTSKSADGDRTLSSQMGPSATRRTTSTRFNEEVAVSIPKPSSSVPRTSGERSAKLGGESSQKSAKRNSVVLASNAANKTKPAFVRQRSLAGTSRDVPPRSSSNQNLARSPKSLSASVSTRSPFVPKIKLSPEPASITGFQGGANPYPTRVGKRSSPDLPSSGALSEESEDDDDDALSMSRQPKSAPKIQGDAPRKASAKLPETAKPLVDPNFRAKFIDRTQASQRSLTDLSSFARKSSALVPTSASYQATGIMESLNASSFTGRSQGREAFTNVTTPLKAPASAGPEAMSNEAPTPLPTTKSQLTLLLEKEKSKSTEDERKSRKTDP